jgi:hypothetical protein
MKGEFSWVFCTSDLTLCNYSNLLRISRSRTVTPIKVAHEFVLQVFFSVEGEDLVGNQINDGDASGVMRMLVLPIPVMMPSVSTRSGLESLTADMLRILLRISAVLLYFRTYRFTGM